MPWPALLLQGLMSHLDDSPGGTGEDLSRTVEALPAAQINTYMAFAKEMLPRIRSLGYNALQIMAIQEHAYYGSFGYHVTNFFAVSSRPCHSLLYSAKAVTSHLT